MVSSLQAAVCLVRVVWLAGMSDTHHNSDRLCSGGAAHSDAIGGLQQNAPSAPTPPGPLRLEDHLLHQHYGLTLTTTEKDTPSTASTEAPSTLHSSGSPPSPPSVSSPPQPSPPQPSTSTRLLTDQNKSPRVLEDQVQSLHGHLESALREDPLFYLHHVQQLHTPQKDLLKLIARREMRRNGARRRSLLYGEVVLPDFRRILRDVVLAPHGPWGGQGRHRGGGGGGGGGGRGCAAEHVSASGGHP